MKVGLLDEKRLNNIKENELYFKELIDYRTLVRNSFKDYIKEQISLDKLIKTTNNILLKAKVHPQIINENDSFVLEYIPNASKYNELLTKIAIELIKLLNSKEFKYLKKCDNHKCSLYFIDTSRNHSRRWCSMEICGNRSKVSNFVKRKKDLIK